MSEVGQFNPSLFRVDLTFTLRWLYEKVEIEI